MLVEGIYTLLMGYAPLATIVSDRISPIILPKNPQLPAVTYFEVVSSASIGMDSTALTTSHVQVDVWALDYLTAKRGCDAIHSLLDGFSGTLSDGTVVKTVTSTDIPDIFEKDSLYYRCGTTYSVQH